MQTARIDGVALEYQVVGSGEPALLIRAALADAFVPVSMRDHGHAMAAS